MVLSQELLSTLTVTAFGLIEMTIELEGDGDEQFAIESMEVKETANDEGIFVLCNYVSGCEYEFQDDAELRPNTFNQGFVLEGFVLLLSIQTN